MVDQSDRVAVASKSEISGVCYADAGMEKSNAHLKQADSQKGNSANKHLPGCLVAYDAAHYPATDDASIKKGGYTKHESGSGFSLTKGNETWSYDENGQPLRHDVIVGKQDFADFPSGMKRTWTNRGIETSNPDGSTSEDNTDKTGFTKDRDGKVHHWGPTDADNYDTHKEGDADVKVYAKDGRKEYTYPNGDKKYESADGKTGYTVHKTASNSPYFPDREETHWGKTAEETYTLRHYALASVKEFADGHTQTDYESGQQVVHRGNQTVSTGGSPEYNYTRTEDPTTHAISLKFKDGREFFKDASGSYLVKDGKRIAIGAIPNVTDS